MPTGKDPSWTSLGIAITDHTGFGTGIPGISCSFVNKIQLRKTKCRGDSPSVCVCTIWIDVKPLILQGVTGVPGGSVTNEDTSPGPVQTYLRDCGGAPGRI